MDNNQKVRQDEEFATQNRARMLGVRYVDSRYITDKPLVKEMLNLEEMYQNTIVPISKSKGRLTFAITINTSQRIMQQFRNKFSDYNVDFAIISNSGFKDLMVRFDPPKEVHYDDIQIKSEGESATLKDVSQTLETVKSDDILDYLITQADALGASDIHLEAEKDHVRMRFRIDGTLHLIAKLSQDKYRQLQSSVAIKAGISTSAPEAQTGHLTHEIRRSDSQKKTLNMRIETAPTLYGQDAVIRLFNIDTELLNIEKLGINQRHKENIGRIIQHPHGLVLVVGPTGSGKTTTMYSILNHLNDPSRKIITLEDPIEYGFAGISQIPVKTRDGKSFAETLRAVLRQDPDVIMIGEIRDIDTAKTAMQAALTGHLVLSTFHASDAAAALSRMQENIGDNPLFASSIELVVAQRLVRRLDDSTKQAYSPDGELLNQIQEVVNTLPEGLERPSLDNLQLYRPGKSESNPFGYKGRMVLMEQMVLNEELRHLMTHSGSNLTTEDVKKAAQSQNMLTMLQDGVIKAIAGLTSIEEVYRAVS